MKTLFLTEKQAQILVKKLGKGKMGGEGTDDFQLYIIYEKLIDIGVKVKIPTVEAKEREKE